MKNIHDRFIESLTVACFQKSSVGPGEFLPVQPVEVGGRMTGDTIAQSVSADAGIKEEFTAQTGAAVGFKKSRPDPYMGTLPEGIFFNGKIHTLNAAVQFIQSKPVAVTLEIRYVVIGLAEAFAGSRFKIKCPQGSAG